MGTYKGIRFPDHLAPLVRHMPAVNDHREALAALSGTWDTLALLAHLSDLRADMGDVRASFGELAGELLACLGEELLALAEGALGRRAQIALDLLARTLSERDADIGVLAAEPVLVDCCAAIFERLATRDEVLAFVDAQGRVVVSNDAARLPPGRHIGLRPGTATLRLGGVTHFAAQRQGRLDQGDTGPGWSALALAPVEVAFGEDPPGAAVVAFSGAGVIPQRVLDVPARAAEIQRRLDRMVWNSRFGPGAEPNAFSRSLLHEIAVTGRKTKDQFERASSELLATVAAGLLREARLLAGLAVDMLERGLRKPARVGVGGPPFEAMLQSALPANPGAVAACCGGDGAVMGRTGELPVTLPTSVLSLAPGQSWSGVLVEGGLSFIVGATVGNGDRESENGGCHEDVVIGVVVIPCGHAIARCAAGPPQIANVPGGTEIATFLIGDHLLGVPARDVIECIAVASAVHVWRGGFAQRHVGFVTWNDTALPLVDIAADIDAAGAAQRHALVLQAGEQRFGLLVSELGLVADMNLTEERGLTGHGDAPRLIAQLARSGSVLLPVLSPQAIFSGPSA